MKKKNKKLEMNKKQKLYIIIGVVVIIIIIIIFMNSIISKKRVKAEHMINVINRSTESIDNYINGNITSRELSNKLKQIEEYCEEFEDRDKELYSESERLEQNWTLCFKIKLIEDTASKDAIYKGTIMEYKAMSLSYWEDEKKDILEYKKYFE